MGCDIHFHIEIKTGTDIWHHYSAPDIDRNYAFFGFLAGVRNSEIKPIKTDDDKLPVDASFITKLNYYHWEGCCHNIRVFGQKEIKQMYDRWQEYKKYIGHENKFFEPEWHVLKTYLFGNSFVLPDKEKYEENGYNDPLKYIEDIRFIFWFDN